MRVEKPLCEINLDESGPLTLSVVSGVVGSCVFPHFPAYWWFSAATTVHVNTVGGFVVVVVIPRLRMWTEMDTF